ncbi:Aste57867_17745 [Aphanomyces stellatus]|uniref:Aste57867_17745 protein n=1 Tax=Aphanomyces stellatus TaxID=120398 RepID=A0A485LA20_9STRA|nr:hypothetical protein As57867_017684 [Aphanomyces stellatus]VFT94491.1 Aste57867_17745 [Aphanomyces stellatus]
MDTGAGTAEVVAVVAVLPRKQRLLRRVAIVLVALRVLWALAIPIKNVSIIAFPQFRPDDLVTTTQSYAGFNAKRSFSGDQVLALLQHILALSLDHVEARAVFEKNADFSIDELGQILSPQDHHLFAQYYTLVIQTSEFPGGVFTPRTETIARVQPDGSILEYTIGCRADHSLLSGTTCVDRNGVPCDDSAWGDEPPSITLQDVDFTPLLNGTGWQNNIGLLALVEYFHMYMRLLFAKQDWSAVVATQNIDLGFLWVTNDTLVETAAIVSLATQGNSAVAQNSTTIWNCLATEIVLGEAYLANYTLGLIQTALLQRGLYNASVQVTSSSVVAERALVVCNSTIHITSGAGVAGYTETINYLQDAVMTHTTISSVNLKHDRPMTGAVVMGSSMRNMLYLGYYPNSYYSVLYMYPNGTHYVFESRALGGMFAGYNGFKFDFVHNTMTNFKLAERSAASGSGYPTDWYADEAAIAAWYAAYEIHHRGSGNLIDVAAIHFGPITPLTLETSCYQALFKRIAQAVWLLTLEWHPITEHLAFMSVNADSTPQLFFLQQMLKTELVGENPYGYRMHIPFNPINISTSHGTAWPLVPLLRGLVLHHGVDAVLDQLQSVLNETFLTLTSVENGLFMFSDVDACPLGVSTLGVTSDDSAQTAYEKLYPALSSLLNDTLDVVDDLGRRMQVELNQSINVRGEYWTDKRENSIFKYEGPPVYWHHSALAVGLMRLSTHVSPDDTIVATLKASLVCYDVLETRYLNRSTRCWSELNTLNETRAKHNSEGLQTMLLSFWSLGLMLNLFGAVVALRFALRVWHVTCTTSFEERWSTVLCIDIQQFGLSSMAECGLMACSTLPFMFSYQMPQDGEYIANSSKSHLGSVYLDQFMVTLGLTWFIRLGMDVGASCMHLRFKNAWFAQFSIIKLGIMLGVYLVRIATFTSSPTYNAAVTSLLLSCGTTALAGMLAMLLSFAFDKPPMKARVDPISHALLRANVPRNVFCLFSQRGTVWSHMGLVLEGWTCATLENALVFKHSTNRLLLIVRESDFQVRWLHEMNKKQFLALERTPSSERAKSRTESIARVRTKSSSPAVVPQNGSTVPRRGATRLGHLIVLGQVFWALSIPLRNVLLFPYPTLQLDNATTTTSSFSGYSPSANVSFSGWDVLTTMQRVLDISLTNDAVRKLFESTGEFAIDQVGDILDPQDHKTFAMLYAMVVQSSEFPGGRFTVRQETIAHIDSSGTTHLYTVGCRADQQLLQGTTCVDANGWPCMNADDATHVLQDIDLTSKHSHGWQNNIGLLSAVEYFFYYMRLVFSKQRWASVVAAGNRGMGSASLTSDGYLIETSTILAIVANSSHQVTHNSTRIWNCVATELVLAEMYVANFTLRLIQDALVAHQLYGASPLVRHDDIVALRASAVFNQTLHITTAAGYTTFAKDDKTLFGNPMTMATVSSAVLKRDLNLNNGDAMGSSVRHLLTLAMDQGQQFCIRFMYPAASEYVVETRVLGGLFGGYLGFKNDPVHNTMGVMKLAERRRSTSNVKVHFDDEATVAAWYASYEVNEKAAGNFLSQAAGHFGGIDTQFFNGIMTPDPTGAFETMCFQALLRRVAQIVWLTALRLSPAMQYIVFMSAQSQVSDHDWFLQQMLVDEIVGENSNGGRVHFPYDSNVLATTNLGNGWPLVPLLVALNQVFHPSVVHDQIMLEMNRTFTSLVEIENGLINFRDIPHCPIGLATFGVTPDDTLDSFYAKTYAGFDGIVHDVIAGAGHVHTTMEAALLSSIRVPLVYLMDPRPPNAEFAFHGPPNIQWTHSALGIGLMKLSTKDSPFVDVVQTLHDAMVCYDTLETRYLNASIRCWAEIQSVDEANEAYSSEPLRLVIFSAWAIGVVLNAIGACIVGRYALKLWRVWHLTGLEFGDWEQGLLLSTHLQNLGGLISIEETAILACSSTPLQLGYFMTQDPSFILSTTTFRLPYVDELVMTLGLTWTIHFGMELASQCIQLRYRNTWFVAQNTAAKLVLATLVYVVLVLTRCDSSYNQAVGSLVSITIFAFAAGFTSMSLSAAFDRPPPEPLPVDIVLQEDHLTESFRQARLPRNRFGYLSLQSGRWSLVGIALEGWRGVETGPMSYLMACGNVLLNLSAGGVVEPIACSDISKEKFICLMQATSAMKKTTVNVASSTKVNQVTSASKLAPRSCNGGPLI